MSINQLLTRLHDELAAHRGDTAPATNFSSFLRVCCLRYLMLQQEGRIPADTTVPIRSLDARAVLDSLPPSWVEPRAGGREPRAGLRGKAGAEAGATR